MITCTIPYKAFNFPVGEPQIQLAIEPPSDVNVTWEFGSVSEVIELMLLVDALVRQGHRLHKLIVPYMPFSRQDRVMNPGESLSVSVMADVINACRFKHVVVTDPHSDVTSALLNNCIVIEQHEVFKDKFPMLGETILVSPDGGALKKIYKLAKITGLEVLECSKKRDVKTGEITGITLPARIKNGYTHVIVDDICDGGRTFIELAVMLRSFGGARRIILMVTHGFMTKGLGVFDGLIDEIYTRKGRVK